MNALNRYLDSLAVELIVEILRGIDIYSIVSIAQILPHCQDPTLRQRKIVWTDACDVVDIPLQTGETPATTPTQSILSLAMRAVLIRSRLQNPERVPRDVRKVRESGQKLLPGGQWMLFTQDKSLWVLNIRDRSTNPRCAPIFVPPPNYRVSQYAFEALGNRDMRLAVGLEKAPAQLEADPPQIAIVHLHFPLQQSAESVQPEDIPHATSAKLYPVPASPMSIFLKGPLVLLRFEAAHYGDDPFFGAIFDCKTEVGVRLEARMPIAQADASTGTIWYWQDLRIHPDLKNIVLRGLMHPRPAPPRVDVLLADIPSLPDPPQAGLNAAAPPNLFESLQVLQFTHAHFEKDHSPAHFPLPRRYVPIIEYPALHSRELVCLCLDTQNRADGDGEFVSFSVAEEVVQGSTYAYLCSKTFGGNSLGPQSKTDPRVIVAYIDDAYTMSSSLEITPLREVTQDTDVLMAEGNYCTVSQFDATQGLILLAVETYIRIESPPGSRSNKSTWLIRY
ncbi:hypothetical protein SISNIDRAFT_552038 [Sistotremastrum niveocremeum HHB9708]|uniref:Uncharacterized protein n=1 Tax=Sistotremastrum niveocremeum HHB9708 TaxID=1314777 RepID=A0A164Q9E6_9AGAM|nr:hypothetical protein SISNIDRAFT_552038 [Sistotremastrum niveocremeum HHB9708]